jgi:hypothetical protein
MLADIAGQHELVRVGAHATHPNDPPLLVAAGDVLKRPMLAAENSIAGRRPIDLRLVARRTSLFNTCRVNYVYPDRREKSRYFILNYCE